VSISAEQYREAARLLGDAKSIFITSHIRPDGDAIGCVVAMRQVLRALGKQVLPVLLDPSTPRYAMLTENEAIPLWLQDVGPNEASKCDALLILDTCAYDQLEPIAEFVRCSKAVKIAVDHHRTRDVEADCYLVDDTAPAASLLVWDWCKQMDWPIDDVAAQALFVGMSTDCGWFRNANTSAALLAACGELADRGVRPDVLHQRLYQSDPAERLRLLGEMLGTLELHVDGRVAVLHITGEMFRRSGANHHDTEDLINVPQQIASVNVTALLVEEDDGRIRLSLRSKRDVDVARIAELFGGGGHARAAGARRAMPLADFKRDVIREVLAAVDAGHE